MDKVLEAAMHRYTDLGCNDISEGVFDADDPDNDANELHIEFTAFLRTSYGEIVAEQIVSGVSKEDIVSQLRQIDKAHQFLASNLISS